MPISPDLNADGVLRVSLQANGSLLPPQVQLLSLRVRRAVNTIPWARVVIEDGDVAQQTFEVADGDLLKPGTELSIHLGYGNKDDLVFKGTVTRFGIRIGANNLAQLEVECRDKAAAMTIGRRHRVFVDKTDSDVCTELIGEYGLTADVEATIVSHKVLVQHDSSDWDFLLTRAEANGRVVVVTDGKVSVKKPDTQAAAALKLSYGQDLMAFEAEMDARTQLSGVDAVSWDPATQAALKATAHPPALGLQGNLGAAALAKVFDVSRFDLRSSAAQPQQALAAWAEARQLKAGLARVRGRMKFQGSALALAGGTLQVAGVGERFNGTVYAGAVQHDAADGNWTTEVDFGLAPDWLAERLDVTAPPAAALVPGVQGLQIAVVVKLDGDPEGGHRIQVREPALEAQATPIWARLLMPYASNGFGALFVPEIGDEVLVGHLAGDPAHPVVLGSLYSKMHAGPHALEATNKLKTLLTRCKHKLEFDDEDKIITITTPAGNSLVFSDKDKKITLKDQTGNEIVMSEAGIKLDSPKDVVINAKGKVTVSAVGAITLDAKADVKASGMNVQCEAQVGFTAKGNASAELSASGVTTVKGSMVMIN
jgi:Rhs element Vgr protein